MAKLKLLNAEMPLQRNVTPHVQVVQMMADTQITPDTQIVSGTKIVSDTQIVPEKRFMPVVIILTLLLILFASCTSKSGQEIPQHLLGYDNLTIYDEGAVAAAAIHIKKKAHYPGEDHIHFASIHAIDVDREGNVYIAEIADGSTGIYVFSDDGSYIGQTGRDGDGPGEFRGLMDIHVSGDTLYTLDMSLNRIQIFSLPDRTLADIIMYDTRGLVTDPLPGLIPQIEYPLQFLKARDASILISFVRSNSTIDTLLVHQVNYDGEFGKRDILKIRHAEWLGAPDLPHRIPALFLERGFLQMSAGNNVITANGNEILIKEFDGDGVYQRAFYHPFNNRTLHSSEIHAMYGTEDDLSGIIQRILSYNALPSAGPAFDAMIVDDENRIWIATIVDDREERKWWVMDRDGKLHSKFRWPAGREIKKIAKGSIYALDTDPETHEETVGRYVFFYEE